MPGADTPGSLRGRVAGKVCVVTGAGSGIGRAIAIRLAEEGGMVLCADLSANDAAATAGQIAADGGEALDWVVDVSDPAAVNAMVAAAADRWGGVDVLVNKGRDRGRQADLRRRAGPQPPRHCGAPHPALHPGLPEPGRPVVRHRRARPRRRQRPPRPRPLARAPWYRTKAEPSTADMIAKLRRVLIAARYLPAHPAEPTPEETRTLRLAWEGLTA
ncbi:MAG TPA: SDR family NAD(P)-dependent oxidoreductase [Streptosporangiaceae bacterium]|nr:SDR family NAD(P)-dependent oxidoreductase [Streptosporangiaceae bacterium]